MATTQQEFKDAASEVFIEFADFLVGRDFVKAGSYDPVTGTTTGDITENVPSLREDYDKRQIDGQSIQSNDFKLLVEAVNFATIAPNVDDLTVTVDGKRCKVIGAMIDAANAVYTIQVRG